MRNTILRGLIVLAAALATNAQATSDGEATQKPRVLVTTQIPAGKNISTAPIAAPTALPKPQPIQKVPVAGPLAGGPSQASNLNHKGLGLAQLRQRISDARRYLTSRPLAIGSSEAVIPTTLIRVAFLDARTRQIDSYVIPKEQFLAAGLAFEALSASGSRIISRAVRGNGVNTPLVVTDANGTAHLPLVVQFPRENRGVMSEMAYYVSTHPGIVTPEVVNAGRMYVKNTIDAAREQLRRKGYVIQPKVADIAERLATVEHVDHTRFRTEFHPNIYNDIFTLYALNEGQTYRYSVSSAGAGGMVQMIAPTYRMVRSRFPGAALNADFVSGMRDHLNASQAMLLYMQMTWNDLAASPTVQSALATGIATQEHLMAAGYNSNPAKLPNTLSRGGAGWKFIVPRETQVYLQIWDSLERNVRQPARTQ